LKTITKNVRLRLGALLDAVPIERSLSWYVLCAAGGMPRAFTMIGYSLESCSTYKRLWRTGNPFYWYRLGARLGDYMGAYNLAQCYSVGRGTPLNKRLAVVWWRKAALAGHIRANTDLGAAYYNGDGIQKNHRKSLLLYGQASLGGDRLARRMLNELNWEKVLPRFGGGESGKTRTKNDNYEIEH
jgi:hypothetical protein